MTQSLRTVVLSFAAIAFVGVALAQQPPQANPGQRPMTSPPAQPAGSGQSDPFEQQLREIAKDPQTASDKLFVLGCSQETLFAVEIARQAEQRAQNSLVKSLAQQIVRDHQQARQSLDAVAKELDIEVPQELSPMHKQMLQIIGATPSDQYEKWFTVMTQAHHASALVANRGVAQITQNPAVREYAQKQVTMLAKHYDQAQAAALALGLPSSGPEAIPASGRIEGENRNIGAGNTTPGPNTPRP